MKEAISCPSGAWWISSSQTRPKRYIRQSIPGMNSNQYETVATHTGNPRLVWTSSAHPILSRHSMLPTPLYENPLTIHRTEFVGLSWDSPPSPPSSLVRTTNQILACSVAQAPNQGHPLPSSWSPQRSVPPINNSKKSIGIYCTWWGSGARHVRWIGG